jgi:Zn-dependent protease with chaperone function
MKIFNLVFAVLFLLFAALQYNDPDPYLWVPIYIFGAVICWLCSKQKYNRPALIAGIIFFAGYALMLFFEKDGVLSWITEHDAENIAGSMKAENPWIEDSREFFGLLILMVVFAINLYRSKTNRPLPRSA